jgi:hypothetical protein
VRWQYVAFMGEESCDGDKSVVGKGVGDFHWEYYICIVYPALMKQVLLGWVLG